MKHNIEPKILAIFLSVAALVALSQPAHAEDCSTATVAGKWAGTLTGTLILPSGPVPVAAVLSGTADVEGNITGTEARNIAGGYADETFIGKWTVNSDCTGSISASFYEAGQLVRVVVDTVVFDQRSKELRMVQKSLTLPDGTQVPVVSTAEGKKQ